MFFHLAFQRFQAGITSSRDFTPSGLFVRISNGVGEKSRFLGLLTVADDFNQFGITKRPDFEIALTEDLKSLILAQGTFRQFHGFGQSPRNIELLNNWIQNFLTLNHLKLSLKEDGVKSVHRRLKNL